MINNKREKVRIGSRKSKLALWQSEAVATMLNQKGLATEIITTETLGDKILHTSIAKIGSKGVFTEEIEMMLKSGDIDIAVHSAKDMPSTLPKGFRLIAFTEREKANDVLVSDNRFVSLENMDKPICIGTSSVRRVAMLRHFYPHVQIVDMRGNLQTRIKKMQSGVCDALMLAYAGIKRMNYDHMIVAEMPVDEFVPPVGQGSIAIESFDSIDQGLENKIRECVNHPPTEAVLTAERSFLKKLEGGCSIPAFAMGKCTGETILLNAGLISVDGRKILKETLTGEKKNAQEIGKKAGIRILESGGREILDEIKALNE
jgi:hydroxymethylbilane synthase